jgi:hypothetical protein
MTDSKATAEQRLKDFSNALRFGEKLSQLYKLNRDGYRDVYTNNMNKLVRTIENDGLPDEFVDMLKTRIAISQEWYEYQATMLDKESFYMMGTKNEAFFNHIQDCVDVYATSGFANPNIGPIYTVTNDMKAINCADLFDPDLDIYEIIKPIDHSDLFEKYVKSFSSRKASITSTFNGMLDQYREFQYYLYNVTHTTIHTAKASLLVHAKRESRNFINF